MKTFTKILGNSYTQPEWVQKLKDADLEYLSLDPWTAQKSRFVQSSDRGIKYGIALTRHHRIENGDVLDYDSSQHKALVIRIHLNPVLMIDLQQIVHKTPEDILRQGMELGHAIGNQHWPAIIKGDKVYVPLSVDPKVMLSVMDTHRFEDITYTFQEGQEVIPFLAPHEIRKLFGGTSHMHAQHEH